MRHVSAQQHWAHFIPLFRGQALSKVQGWNLLTGVHQLPQHRVSRPQHWHEPVAKQLEKEMRPAFNPAMVWFVWFEGEKLWLECSHSAGVKYFDLCPSTQAILNQALTRAYLQTAVIWKWDLLSAQPHWAHIYFVVQGPSSDQSAEVKYLDLSPPNTLMQTL